MKKQDAKVFLLYITSIILMFFRNTLFFLPNRTYFFGDTGVYSLYLSAFAKNFQTIISFKDNFLFWNDSYMAVGMPTLLNVDHGYLYFPNILISFFAFLLKDPFLTFDFYRISIYLHLAVSAFFVYLLLKNIYNVDKMGAFIGGFIWMTSGFCVENISAAPVFFSGSYLPLCMYYLEKYLRDGKKTDFLLTNIFLGTSFLAGYPIISVITTIFIYLYYILKEFNYSKVKLIIIKIFFGLIFVVIPIISFQYFSTFINFPYTARASKLTLDSFLQNPIPIRNILESFIPNNSPANTNNSTKQIYVYFSIIGVLVILNGDIASLLRQRRDLKILVILGFVFLLIGLGRAGVIATLLYYVPGMSFFRRLSAFAIIPSFVFSVLIGVVFSRINLENLTFGIRNKIILVSSFLIVFFSLLLMDSFDYFFKIVPLMFIFFFYLFGNIFKFQPQMFERAVLVLIFIEQVIFVNSKFYLNSKVDPKDAFGNTPVIRLLKNFGNDKSKFNLLQTQNVYSTDVFGMNQTSGYLALATKYGVDITEKLNAPNYDDQKLNSLLGVDILATTNKDIFGEKVGSFPSKNSEEGYYYFDTIKFSWEPISTPELFSIYQNALNNKEIYYVPDKLEYLNPDEDIFKKISESTSSEPAFIYEEIPQLMPAEVKKILSYRNLVSFDVKGGPSYLVLRKGYFPGWYIWDGKNLMKPDIVNTFFQGKTVASSDNNHVNYTFIYFPLGIIFSIGYCVITLLVYKLFSNSINKLLNN